VHNRLLIVGTCTWNKTGGMQAVFLGIKKSQLVRDENQKKKRNEMVESGFRARESLCKNIREGVIGSREGNRHDLSLPGQVLAGASVKKEIPKRKG